MRTLLPAMAQVIASTATERSSYVIATVTTAGR
jgi:hypothetical protein